MKYTEDNIDGVKFHHKNDPLGILYTIDKDKNRVTWSDGLQDSYYTPLMMVGYLNDGTWIPVEQREEVYDIY